MFVNIDHKKKKIIKTTSITDFRYLHELCHYSEIYPRILVVFVVKVNGFQALNMVKEVQLRYLRYYKVTGSVSGTYFSSKAYYH